MRGSIVITLLLAAIATTEIVASIAYRPMARVGPWGMGGLVLALCIAQLVREFRRRPEMETTEESIPGRNYITTAVWFIGLLVATYFLGMAIVFPLFVLFFLKQHGWGWILSISLAIGMFALLYGIFEKGTGIILYQGVLLE